MSSISKLTASIVSGTTLASAKAPALPPLTNPPTGGIDPKYRAIDPKKEGSFLHYFTTQQMGTFPLKDLDALTKLKARLRHYLQGPDFPEYNDGLMHGRLIQGTSGEDLIEVRYEPSTGGAYVTRGTRKLDEFGHMTDDGVRETSYLDAEEARSLRIVGGAGDDRIEVDPRFPYPVHLIGGGGNDILIGGAGNDLIELGTGRDIAVGNGGVDHVVTADGVNDDTILLGTDQDPDLLLH